MSKNRHYIAGKCYDLNTFTAAPTNVIAETEHYKVERVDKCHILVNGKHKIKHGEIQESDNYGAVFAISGKYIAIIAGGVADVCDLCDEKIKIKDRVFLDNIPHVVKYMHPHIIQQGQYFLIVDEDKLEGTLIDTLNNIKPIVSKFTHRYGTGFCPYTQAIINDIGEVIWIEPLIHEYSKITIDDQTYYHRDVAGRDNLSPGETLDGLVRVRWFDTGYIVYDLYTRCRKPIIDLRNKCWIELLFVVGGSTRANAVVLPYGKNAFIAISTTPLEELRAPPYYTKTSGEIKGGGKQNIYTIIAPKSTGRNIKPAYSHPE